MKKILLTSAGLTESLLEFMLEKIQKKISDIRILYVPTAGMYHDGGREGLALSAFHLQRIGLLSERIFDYHLGYLLSEDYERTYSRGILEIPPKLRLLTVAEMKQFDIVLVDGGNAEPLLKEMIRTGFDKRLREVLTDGVFYLGISAGSMVMAGNFVEGLRYVANPIQVHCEEGSPCGTVPDDGVIALTNEQAIWIDDNGAVIIQ